MKGDERVQHIKHNIHRLPVAKAFLSGNERAERFPLNELSDQIPVTHVGLASPEDLDHVRVVDLAKGTDLAHYCVITFSVVEKLERSLLALEFITNVIDL